jgi:hypothetical protein
MTTKCSYLWFCSLLALGLASPALAGGSYPTTLNDSEEPGSVLVFYRFTRGGIQTPDQGFQPSSQFKISVTCPNELAASTGCAETGDATTGQVVHLVAHWVCPPDPTTGGSTCAETDFPLTTTVFGTVEFDANGNGAPTPPCNSGYLIVWVEDGLGHRISFNGLIGTAVIRGSGTSWRAYNALPVQSTACVGTTLSADALHFDGTDYQAITGTIYGGVEYPNNENTTLVFLTLDVLSGQPNFATNVGLRFYNESEYFLSTDASFTCWGQFSLGDLAGGALGNDPFTEQDGLVRSTGAVQNGSAATLIGVVETSESLTQSVTGNVTEVLTSALVGTTINPPCNLTGAGGVTGNCNAACTITNNSLCQSITTGAVGIQPGTTCPTGSIKLATVPAGISCAIVTNLLSPVDLTREYTYQLLNDSMPVPTTFVPSPTVITPP